MTAIDLFKGGKDVRGMARGIVAAVEKNVRIHNRMYKQTANEPVKR